jgi:tRNA (guanine-N7-)-methyltransferase
VQETFLPPELRKPCLLDPETLPRPLDFRAVFGRSAPVELEIGVGKGFFLMNAALRQPDTDFLGIEYAGKYLARAIERIEKRPISNVRLVHGEALSFMQNCLGDASLQVIHLYFPDPWPKKRHHKRRLLQMPFLREVHRLLQPGGELLIATDHEEYWHWMQAVLAEQTLLRPGGRLPEPPLDLEGLTNYEIKYLREGRPIYRAGWLKP